MVQEGFRRRRRRRRRKRRRKRKGIIKSFIRLILKLIKFTFILAIFAAIPIGIFYYLKFKYKLKLLNDTKETIQTNFINV